MLRFSQTFRMAENAAKRLKMSPVTIGTHNGHFHADEALAIHMLRQLPEYKDAGLIRTRDPKLLETCHTVVDVGGEYDDAKKRYDHHQRGFETTFPGKPTKLSSAGLVFLHYGKAIIAQRLRAAVPSSANATEESPEVIMLHDKFYGSFIEALDAHDNGISAYDPKAIAAAGIEKRFSDGAFTLGAMVGRLNPNWNDPVPSDPEEAQAAENARFEIASRRIGEEFDSGLDYYVRAWLPAREVVKKAFDARFEHDAQGRILVFEGTSAPWKDHLYSLEENNPSTLYVLYPESGQPGAKWRVQTVPVSKDSFESRKPLPEVWRGFRDQELDGISGIPGCVFVHAAGFIGGNKTFEGAKAMALKALE
ncbi:metal-dependent protein hydrolase [Plectosphaerella plurivora]|uniref:Metal-dependent protein hydrolase n=1 Tax=Plectosphaerella plurivora TaxID=936078 RepID=A0A9P8VG39_9PEZI|nr:metal-dependent protein hydrolase [Plectosphaerella plurivora]